VKLKKLRKPQPDDKAANDMIKTKYKKIAMGQKSQILNTFGKQFPEIMTFVTLD
jgi:hypothetical protein